MSIDFIDCGAMLTALRPILFSVLLSQSAAKEGGLGHHHGKLAIGAKSVSIATVHSVPLTQHEAPKHPFRLLQRPVLAVKCVLYDTDHCTHAVQRGGGRSQEAAARGHLR